MNEHEEDPQKMESYSSAVHCSQLMKMVVVGGCYAFKNIVVLLLLIIIDILFFIKFLKEIYFLSSMSNIAGFVT